MDGGVDKPGIFFSALMIVGNLPFCYYAFRHRGLDEDDAVTRFATWTCIGATFFNATVGVIRSMGRMPNDLTYYTLQWVSLLVWFATLWICLHGMRRKWKTQTAGTVDAKLSR